MTPEERREDARRAKEMVNDPVFGKAVLALHNQWFGELMRASTDPARLELVARLKALEAIPHQLVTYITKELVAQKGNRNG